MRVVPFQDVDPEKWDAVVGGSAEAWLFHLHDWIAVESAHWALENHSFALLDDGGNYAAVCPLYVRSLPRGWQERVLDTGHHRHTGPAFVDGLEPEVRKAGVKILMRRILEEGNSQDVDRIILNAHNLAPANLTGRQFEIPYWVMDYGFRLGLHSGPCGDMAIPGLTTVNADQILDLSPEEGELFRNLDTSFQRAVRKAVKAGLTVTAGETEPIDRYYALARESAKRTGERLPAKEYYLELWERLGEKDRCAVLFARYNETVVGAILLLLYKGSANFLGGVSHGDYLAWRVNNLLHWEAIRWARSRGCARYRLGPVFPELPEDWPISRVSRFKGSLGAASYNIVQGSLFLHPEKYAADAAAAVASLCAARRDPDKRPAEISRDESRKGKLATGSVPGWRPIGADLSLVLNCYGFQVDPDVVPFAVRCLHREPPVLELGRPGERSGVPRLEFRKEVERRLLYPAARRILFRDGKPAYRTLFPSASFSGPDLDPVWQTKDGRPVLAWYRKGGPSPSLILGMDAIEEMVRYRQGDPAKADRRKASDHGDSVGQPERSTYLYEDQVLPEYAAVPWADRLGFQLAELCSRLSGIPLIEPLPGGARGAVILTGDDDQAFLENYGRQLRMIGSMPVTYFLHHLTSHTPDTIACMPENVRFGFHPDALDAPSDYDNLCERQYETVRRIAGRPLRAVRNHGFLNRGYLGHLPVWERLGLEMDVNCPGTDGTALNGSFLPMRVRRGDGTWSDHYTMLTAFGDGMIQPDVTGLTERDAVRRIGSVARQIERERPGVLVVNFHPQNVERTGKLHAALLAVTSRSGWTVIGLEDYLDWVILREKIRLFPLGDGRLRLTSVGQAEKVVLRSWNGEKWHRHRLDPWAGDIEARIP